MLKEFLNLLNSRDSSLIDITFSRLSLNKAKASIEWIHCIYPNGKATLSQGVKPSYTIPDNLLEKDFDYLMIEVENIEEPIKKLQFFLSPEENDYFLEITFSPDDLGNESNLLENLSIWFEKLEDFINPLEYYVRWENASWNYGDEGLGSGVLFKKDNLRV
ncbi:MAG: hypothetical protein RLN88_03230 [Ekhidna sp.]|uniref:hypothetical protein n=1 Tax=Ekhidna sp. TaxID=2608089 RepID=UPI0032F09A20